MPKVSVCIPTYNRQGLLPFAVDSVLKQSFQDWQLIVCDDGSEDNTPALMNAYEAQDGRVRYLRHPQNIGKSNNMRSGFDAAEGDYFIKFDDDDRLTPDFLTQMAAVLDTHPEVDFVSCDHWLINQTNQADLEASEQNSRYWGRKSLKTGVIENLLEVVFIRQSLQVGCTLFRKAALDDVGFMRPDLQNCEDNDLLVRLALAGKVGYYLDERLMEYRVHAEQQSIARDIRYLEDKLKYLEYFHFQDSPTLETNRQQRLQETRLLLGLRYVEGNQPQQGRNILRTYRQQNPANRKAVFGLLMSYLPSGLQDPLWTLARQMTPRSYMEQMRQGN
ncbi:glycosyltransferase family 2 protein [Geitlerinema sp. P-1104]|uniref:glycosyltransferase family 2 protein n=1 Tax=Geitlerinema sp. P-1104 TaxID=2546230 RepID=UPI0014768422|nr:glycosyltransferase family 2 protein [Geitlerinema sp. P-1104]NMG57787.1 glycosyltransferase family 2 protein [Geitlerinema sp. P-1104]